MDIPAPENSECPVCRGILHDPSCLSNCGHLICKCCLTQALQYRLHCPVCRAPADKTGVPQVTAPTGHASAAQSGESTQTLRCRRASIGHIRSTFTSWSVLFGINGVISDNINVQPVGSTPSPASVGQLPAVPSPSRAGIQSSQSVARDPNGSGPYPVAPPLAPAPVHITPSLSLSDVAVGLLLHQSRVNEGCPAVRTFVCPYCNQNGMDELQLRDHCNGRHQNDNPHVVCPICVTLPHGNERYHSRNFIGHLNLRHSYYSQDFMDVNKNDDMNLQAAILQSYQTV